MAALTSTDADTVGTNPATFAITGGADAALFAITGGNLVFNTPRDFDTEPHSYQVEVTASRRHQTTTTAITVNLTDVNDNAPVITTVATQSVAENTTSGGGTDSTDADTVGTNPATFAITGGADHALFAITGGNLVFNTPRDSTPSPQLSGRGGRRRRRQHHPRPSPSISTHPRLGGCTIDRRRLGKMILIHGAHTALNQPLPTAGADTIKMV